MDCSRAYSSVAVPEIGLFPLELVLLPSERVPLHIFEDRYKELIGECLDEGSEFGLILEDEDGLREIGTSTAVLEVIHSFDDGRMNMLVEGRDRFRVARADGGPFVPHRRGRAGRGRRRREPTEARRRRGAGGLPPPGRGGGGGEIDEPDVGSSTLSFQLASRVDFGHELKQELLELRSEPSGFSGSPSCSSAPLRG